jgi:hypothetical protein
LRIASTLRWETLFFSSLVISAQVRWPVSPSRMKTGVVAEAGGAARLGGERAVHGPLEYPDCGRVGVTERQWLSPGGQ